MKRAVTQSSPITVYRDSCSTKGKRTYFMLKRGKAGCLHLEICSPEQWLSGSLNSWKKYQNNHLLKFSNRFVQSKSRQSISITSINVKGLILKLGSKTERQLFLSSWEEKKQSVEGRNPKLEVILIGGKVGLFPNYVGVLPAIKYYAISSELGAQSQSFSQFFIAFQAVYYSQLFHKISATLSINTRNISIHVHPIPSMSSLNILEFHPSIPQKSHSQNRMARYRVADKLGFLASWILKRFSFS